MKTKKKILVISECFFPEEFKINDVSFAWADRGFDVTVVTLAPTYPEGKIFPNYENKLFSIEHFNNLKVIRLRAVTGYRNSKYKKVLKYVSFSILASIYTILCGRSYDYVFGFNLGALTDMVPAYIAKRFYKKPTLLWVQDLWPDSVFAYGFKRHKISEYILNSFVKTIYGSMDVLAISSYGFENRLRDFTNIEAKFIHAPNWADKYASVEHKVKLSEQKLIHFTFAGNIGMVQNLGNIVKAFCGLSPQEASRAQLNIIGDGSYRSELEKLVRRCSNVILHGRKKRSEMGQYYQASDFLVLGLINDPVVSLTVPAKFQTYLSAKKPILAIAKGEVSNLVDQHKLGHTADPDDLAAITELFRRCLSMSNDEKQNLCKNNDKLLTEKYNKETVIDDLQEALLCS